MFLVDGQWGDWDEWSDCSRSCGGGTKIRTKLCDNPFPQFGGKECLGPATELSLCNSDRCPGNLLRIICKGLVNTKFMNRTTTNESILLYFFGLRRMC